MNEKNLQDFLDQLIVVLVIYEMKISESQAYSSLQSSLQNENNSVSLIIFDNSTLPQTKVQLDKFQTTYHHDPSNPGVSKAYNEGFKKAKELNKKWMLLADQDTTFPGDFFLKLKENLKRNQKSKLFVPIVRNDSIIISPFRFFLGRGKALQNVKPGTYSLQKVKFINSGLFISVDLFKKCNGYDERFPLDFSDLAFANRILKYEDELVVFDTICDHALSATNNSVEKTLKRFPYFLQASKLYGEIERSYLLLSLNRFLRAIKLTLQFGSPKFLIMFFRNGC